MAIAEYSKSRTRQRMRGKYRFDDFDMMMVNRYKVTAPIAITNTGVMASHLADGSLMTTGLSKPDFPRALLVKGSAAGTLGDVVITGTDINRHRITETIAANGTSAVSGDKAFATVTSVQLPTGTGSISIGLSDKFGLPECMEGSAVLRSLVDGAVDSSPTVAFDPDNVSKNTIIPGTASDATRDFIYYFIAK